MNNEIKRIFIDEEHYTEANFPFTIKPNFSTLGSIVEKSPQEPIIGFVFNVSISNLLGFGETILYEEYNLSKKQVDIISFDNIFLECDIAQGMIFRGKRTGMIHNISMDISPGYNYVEKF